jgi:hypothetical protein
MRYLLESISFRKKFGYEGKINACQAFIATILINRDASEADIRHGTIQYSKEGKSWMLILFAG